MLSCVPSLTEDRSIAVLTGLVTCEDLPCSLLSLVANELVQQSLEDSDETLQARRRALLVNLQQRHPAVLQKTFRDLLEEDKYEKSSVEHLLFSLSLVLPDSAISDGSLLAAVAGGADLVLATVSADAVVRTSAIRGLYARIAKEELNDAELVSTLVISARPELTPHWQTSVHSALLARIQDTSPSVLESLYSSPDYLLPVLLTDAPSYVLTISQVIHSQTSPANRRVLKAHLSFLITHVYPASTPEIQTQIIQELLFPLFPFSKPRHKTAALVWELIESGEKAGRAFGSLGGCVEVVRWEGSKATESGGPGAGHESMEAMANINIALATKLAGTLLLPDCITCTSDHEQRTCNSPRASLHNFHPSFRTCAAETLMRGHLRT